MLTIGETIYGETLCDIGATFCKSKTTQIKS